MIEDDPTDRPTATAATDRRPHAVRVATVRGATGKARAHRRRRQLAAALDPAPEPKATPSPTARRRAKKRADALAEREAPRRAKIAAPIVEPPNPLLVGLIEPGASIGRSDRTETGARGADGQAPSAKSPDAPNLGPAATLSGTEGPKNVDAPDRAPAGATEPVAAVTLPVTPAATAKMSALAATFRARGARRRTVSTVLETVLDAPAPIQLRRAVAKKIGCTAADLEGLTVLELHAGVAAIRAGTEGEWWDRIHDRLDPKKRRIEHTGADGGAIQTELTLRRELTDRDAADVYKALLEGGRAAIEDADLVEPTPGAASD